MKTKSTSMRLKEIMDIKGLKQVNIVEMAQPYCKEYNVKLGKNDLSQYVSGKVVPKQNKIYILAKALDVSETWLMGYDVPMERINDELQEKKEKVTNYTQKISLKYREKELIENFKKLNDLGQKEALKRIEELTFINKYTLVIKESTITDVDFAAESTANYMVTKAANLDGDKPNEEQQKAIDEF